MAGFGLGPLNAIFAGIGQGIDNIQQQRQREQQLAIQRMQAQNAMLQLQNYLQDRTTGEQGKTLRGVFGGGLPTGAGAGGGTSLAPAIGIDPSTGMPGSKFVTPKPMNDFGAPGEYGAGQQQTGGRPGLGLGLANAPSILSGQPGQPVNLLPWTMQTPPQSAYDEIRGMPGAPTGPSNGSMPSMPPRPGPNTPSPDWADKATPQGQAAEDAPLPGANVARDALGEIPGSIGTDAGGSYRVPTDYGSEWANKVLLGKGRQQGNIDLNNRPVVRNANGSISTVRSMSFNEDGQEILIPTVAEDGSRILSDKEAIDQYHRTGKYLGKFNTPEEATAYGQKLHQQQAQKYAQAGPQTMTDAGGGTPGRPPPPPDYNALRRQVEAYAAANGISKAAVDAEWPQIQKDAHDRWREQVEDYDKNKPQSGHIIQTDKGPMLVDPRTGQVRPVQLPGGAHVQSGSGAAGWEFMQTPQGIVRINKGTGQVEPVDLPQGTTRLGTSSQSAPDPRTVDYTAKMIAGYNMAPLTGWSLRSKFGQEVMSKVEQLNPQYDATKYAAKLRGAVAFTTGRQGDAVRSFSVSIDHLAVLDDVATALANDDMQALNKLKNDVQKQFGYAGPIEFNFVKTVVGDEISKAIIAGVGSTTDRQQLQQGFDLANSPEQLVGVVQYAKRLMAGQLGGYRRQAGTAGFSLDDFEKALSPRAKAELEALPGGTTDQGSPPPSGGPASSGAAPPWATGMTTDGKGTTIYTDGKGWFHADHTPVQ